MSKIDSLFMFLSDFFIVRLVLEFHCSLLEKILFVKRMRLYLTNSELCFLKNNVLMKYLSLICLNGKESEEHYDKSSKSSSLTGVNDTDDLDCRISK